MFKWSKVVLVGLELAWTRGFRRVELHVDSKAVVNTLTDKTGGTVSGTRLVWRIVQWLELDWEVKVCHSYRETNKLQMC